MHLHYGPLSLASGFLPIAYLSERDLPQRSWQAWETLLMERDNVGLAFGYLDGMREQPESKTGFTVPHMRNLPRDSLWAQGFQCLWGIVPSPLFWNWMVAMQSWNVWLHATIIIIIIIINQVIIAGAFSQKTRSTRFLINAYISLGIDHSE